MLFCSVFIISPKFIMLLYFSDMHFLKCFHLKALSSFMLFGGIFLAAKKILKSPRNGFRSVFSGVLRSIFASFFLQITKKQVKGKKETQNQTLLYSRKQQKQIYRCTAYTLKYQGFISFFTVRENKQQKQKAKKLKRGLHLKLIGVTIKANQARRLKNGLFQHGRDCRLFRFHWVLDRPA